MVSAHSDDLLPGLFQDGIDAKVRFLPDAPSITFLKKSLCQDPGHTQREEDSTELETIPCTDSNTAGVEECTDQLSQVLFKKVEFGPNFFAYFCLS